MKSLRAVTIALSLLGTSSAIAATSPACQQNTTFNVGTGIYDITGPAAEEGMMGYGMLSQTTAGILQRLWARAFVIESPCNDKRVVIVNTDLGMVFQGVQQEVMKRLKAKYGDRYTDKNVLLTATHTHSGPGGLSTHTFYNLTTLGMSRKNLDTIVEGIVTAIDRATSHMQPAQIKMAEGELTGISFNRSPESYLLNPESERNRYAADVDTTMTLLRFDNLQGQPIAMMNWFPLHGVSMNNKNYLINGDNKGYAEYLFEKDFKSNDDEGSFVAAFLQANAGDVSPNEYGHEGGEGLAGVEAIEKAGKPQYAEAKTLFNSASDLIQGGIDYRQTFVKMDEVTVDPIYTGNKTEMTCPAGIGVSMLAGTQDGEGFGAQGLTCETLPKYIPAFICEKSKTECQGVKPIVLETGTKKPNPWTPNILPLQIIQIGHLYIIAPPFEITTMTGRRIKEAVKKLLPADEKNTVVLSGLSNAYSGYVATNDEYQLQRYEGASTHFGPWTASALVQEFSKLTTALVANQDVADGPLPPDLIDTQSDYRPGVLFDDTPFFKNFGDVYQDANPSYHRGETVTVAFWGAHPKNNYHTQGSFFEVQKLVDGAYVPQLRDRDWGVEYHWARTGFAESLVTIVWRISQSTPPGTYRIAQYGDSKALMSGTITPYTGYSAPFTVL